MRSGLRGGLMAKKSRTKGKTGEREVGHLLTDAGFDASREQDGRNQACDFRIHSPAIDLEVRRREQLSLKAWSREIEAKTPEGRIPAVAYRTNGEPWRISLPLDRFLHLLSTNKEG